MTLDHRLDRTISIRAPRETVFRFFTDAARWASWWGKGSTIDARPGGRVSIRYPDGTEAAGEVLDLVAPERITFSYGFVTGKPFPAGGSRVTLNLEQDGAGTRLHLTHAFPDAAARDEFVQGWRYQLSLFANVVADEVNAGAAALIDEWFYGVARARRQRSRADARADQQRRRAVPRPIRVHRRPGRSRAAHFSGAALHAWAATAAAGRCAPVSRHRARRVGRGRGRRNGTRIGDERVHLWRGRPH